MPISLCIDKHAYQKKNVYQKAASLNYRDIKNILVIKFAGLGDLLLTSPFLKTIRRNFPNAKITLITDIKPFFHPGLYDELIVIKRRKGILNDIQNFKKCMALPFQELILDITESTRSMIITRAVKGYLKIGYKHKGLDFLFYDIAINRTSFKFEADSFLDILRVLGIEGNFLDFEMPEPVIMPLEKDSVYICLVVGSAMPEKNWPLQNYFRLAQMIRNDTPNCRFVIPVGPSENKEEIENIFKQDKSLFEKVIFVFPLLEFAYYAVNSKICITNDTGLYHLSIAYKVPTLVIFQCGHQYRYCPRTEKHQYISQDNGGIEPENVYQRYLRMI